MTANLKLEAREPNMNIELLEYHLQHNCPCNHAHYTLKFVRNAVFLNRRIDEFWNDRSRLENMAKHEKAITDAQKELRWFRET